MEDVAIRIDSYGTPVDSDPLAHPGCKYRTAVARVPSVWLACDLVQFVALSLNYSLDAADASVRVRIVQEDTNLWEEAGPDRWRRLVDPFTPVYALDRALYGITFGVRTVAQRLALQ